MRIPRGLTTITVLLALTGLLTTSVLADTRTVFYLSVGTSLSVGIEPNLAGHDRRTQEGYGNQLYEALLTSMPQLRLVKLGCPGETSATMITGGICDYEEGSQLTQAASFLRDHRGSVALVTIDMGANDIEPCGGLSGIDPNCVTQAINHIAANLPVILAALRDAAGPDVPIVGMNYYNPFLAAWFVNPALAVASAQGLLVFNGLLELIYTNPLFGVPVADVAGAFFASDFTPVPEAGGIPRNVLVVCQLTSMCAPPPVGPNIHANADGYGVIAGALSAVLP